MLFTSEIEGMVVNSVEDSYKIGIDAKWFFKGPPSGRVVIQNLVEQLVKISAKDEFYIFLDKKARKMDFPCPAPNVRLVYIWAGNNMISNIFFVPFVAYKLKLDVFLFQNFSSVFSNFNRCVFIHDVIFEQYPHLFSFVQRVYFFSIKYLAFLACVS